jgi:PHD/YefM family antitoxin component YafN of YafNO toxin-antitoxin module
MTIHPQFIEREGKKEFVVIPYEEFLAIQEIFEDYEDLKDLREAKSLAEKEAGVALSSIRSELLEG